MEEIWKDVDGYEGLYQVSNMGRVKSLKRTVRHNRGGPKIIKEKIIKLSIVSGGYLSACLAKNGTKKTYLVHRLVATAFLIKNEHQTAVNHIDCDKTNNVVTNLEWCTYKQNMVHAIENGLMRYNGPKGERAANHKLKTNDVIKIKERLCAGEKPIDIAKDYDTKPCNISNIKTGRSWKHIPWPTLD